MGVDQKQQALLRMLPGVDRVLELAKPDPFFENIPKSVLVRSVRAAVEDLRRAILDNSPDIDATNLTDALVLGKVKTSVKAAIRPNLRRLINATGVVVHTNLGRSLLPADAIENLVTIAGRYSNLEFDLLKGARGSRYSNVEDILCEVSGAESAMVVNNNAGAVLLSLNTIANGKTVIVSRGELIEIGGAFRIPDVMAKSGGILKEVGTTNRTHLKDYESAIENDTGLFLKVHTSNYSIVGFTAQVSLKELVDLGAKYQIPVMEDLGSGTFIDFSRYGLIKEPTVQESVAAGADVITFSGDKLLGGPQAGIIVGKQEILDNIKKNPLTRALRIDKLTLAALEITLRHYRDPDKAVDSIPTLRMLTLPFADIETKARQLKTLLEHIGDGRLQVQLLDMASTAGGGALPLLNLPSKGLGINVQGISPNALEKTLRENEPPIIGRIEEDTFMLDLRTVQDDELAIIKDVFEKLLKNH
ncbi:MAG: L-seryl-tRNA(Sec) selenium transferase [Pseudomonadota bacterium]|uniref:L-seryl-tRNA(Sec) selenium transferase n=1 Tax=Candidatus Desulfatibia profunda TaxID=2841695 RepID=A0A8J6NRU5_9BACT|nr:L-seryl-tRNA(Sec) selenium transferase [Candidatus Desulfatibia profunda]MBL7181096.1 L-seryl-tRNA(Sec) selenium transferase [Desulfobacterales bacterium]